MKTVGTFQVKSLKEAGLVSGSEHRFVASNGKFEVWGTRFRRTLSYKRVYCLTFEAIRMLSKPGEPRRFEKVQLPDGCHSRLDKTLAFLETLP